MLVDISNRIYIETTKQSNDNIYFAKMEKKIFSPQEHLNVACRFSMQY